MTPTPTPTPTPDSPPPTARRRVWYAALGAAVVLALVALAVSRSRSRSRVEPLTAEERHVLVALKRYGVEHELDPDGHVARLVLHGKQVDDDALAELHTLPRLKRLSLHGTLVTDRGMVAVARCQCLENLGLTETEVTDTGLAHLYQVSSLKNVWLTLGGRLTHRGVSDLRRALPTTMVHVRSKERTTDSPRPNVLIILADDMGFSDPGCYGGEIATPNLDALARNGLRFTQFYNTARCWPTRAALLTGYYAQQVRRDTLPGIKSGTQGTRPKWARLLPELMRPLGYRTYHSGKWHVDGDPLGTGFDRSYRLEDFDRHFAPRRHAEDDRPLPPVDPRAGYYSSTVIADHAIRCLQDHAARYSRRPFLTYLAFTAPHFPLQAPAEDIARYRKTYLTGWDAMRADRWDRLKGLKIGGTSLAAIERDLGPPYAFPKALAVLGPNELDRPLPWADLTAEQRAFQANKMAVHAAMVDRMDREIGRVLAQIRAMNAAENTLVFFLSDNGASAEIMVRGDGHDPHAECGTGATFLSIGPGWSSLANTPFRRHKTWVHEGGISTPLIVHWPRGITGRGELRHTPGHVVDLVPTILELAGGGPKPWGNPRAPQPPGKSLVPVFENDRTGGHDSLWWLHEAHRALRMGNWKIVASGMSAEWELYDLSTDRSEAKNLAKEHPEKVKELGAVWTAQLEEYAAHARE